MIEPWTPPPKPPRRKIAPLALAVAVLVLLCALGLVWMIQKVLSRSSADSEPTTSSEAPASAAAPVSEAGSSIMPESEPVPAPKAPVAPDASKAGMATLPEEMRAMWISYLEWEELDISTEEKLRATCTEMFDNCTALGLNTVVVAVRPFGDSFYPSEYFPWSHLITGVQGQDPGYDPLAVMLEEAHARGLRFEAWVNPYRVNGPVYGPKVLSADNPAAQHPEWYTEINGAWYDPGRPEVRELIVNGMREIAEKYDVDGIHIDDYFYPEFSTEQVAEGADVAFDADSYATYAGGEGLDDWRRANVDALVRDAYAAIKNVKAEVSFGVSPQGNNENNFHSQYSDVTMWMITPGYVDYVAPQLYWGFNHQLSNGSNQYAFGNISQEWAAYPRAPEVRLYAGLGVYRIEQGDGGAGDQSEWESGHNLADMVAHLRGQEGYSGFFLFRYNSLYHSAVPERAAQEAAAMAALLAPPPAEAAESASGTAPASGADPAASSAADPAGSTPTAESEAA